MGDAPDLEAVTQVQQKIWSEGDFAMVANIVVTQSDNLVEALQILPDEKVLDVAAGSGNAAIAAARRWADVVGSDFVPELLERGKERAAADRLDIEWVVADAQALPFEDASFDVTTSVFGAMFAPDQPKTASELLRVTKPGGRIGMANWSPEGGIGRMFMTIAKHAPPPPGVNPPLLWGTEDHLRQLFGDGISDLQIERKRSRQVFRSVDHYLEFFRTYFGPMKMAFARVGEDGEAALEQDLRDLMNGENTAGERALVLEPEYLQVIATRA